MTMNQKIIDEKVIEIQLIRKKNVLVSLGCLAMTR
jgi:hypothetical protein